MRRQLRLWAIIVLLEWCVDLTPQEKSSGPLLLALIDAAKAVSAL